MRSDSWGGLKGRPILRFDPYTTIGDGGGGCIGDGGSGCINDGGSGF